MLAQGICEHGCVGCAALIRCRRAGEDSGRGRCSVADKKPVGKRAADRRQHDLRALGGRGLLLRRQLRTRGRCNQLARPRGAGVESRGRHSTALEASARTRQRQTTDGKKENRNRGARGVGSERREKVARGQGGRAGLWYPAPELWSTAAWRRILAAGRWPLLAHLTTAALGPRPGFSGLQQQRASVCCWSLRGQPVTAPARCAGSIVYCMLLRCDAFLCLSRSSPSPSPCSNRHCSAVQKYHSRACSPSPRLCGRSYTKLDRRLRGAWQPSPKTRPLLVVCCLFLPRRAPASTSRKLAPTRVDDLRAAQPAGFIWRSNALLGVPTYSGSILMHPWPIDSDRLIADGGGAAAHPGRQRPRCRRKEASSNGSMGASALWAKRPQARPMGAASPFRRPPSGYKALKLFPLSYASS